MVVRLCDVLLTFEERTMKLMTLMAFTFALIATAPVSAQQHGNGQSRRVPALIVMIDSIQQPDAPYVIMRRPGNTTADLIVLRVDADANQLSEAVRGLLTARVADGDVPQVAATFRVRPHQVTRAATRPALPWAARVVNDLRRAPVREISGVGRARSVQIWLPRQGNGRAKHPT